MNNHKKIKKIAFVILAAGESKRMGSIKQLLQWKEKSLLNHIIDKSIHSLAQATFVVLGANAEKISSSIKKSDIHTIINENWHKGMGTSISAAVNHISQLKENFEGVLLSLVDQPLISIDHFNNLIRTFSMENNGIVATSYPDSIGVPAIFSPAFFNELKSLNECMGAKPVILANINDSSSIFYDKVNVDLDTPDDYRKFINDYI